MTRGFKILTGITLALIIPGGICAAISLKLLTKICVKPAAFKIIDINGTFIKFELSLSIKNPSITDVELDGYDLDVFINNIKVANLLSGTKNIIQGKATSTINLPITIYHKNAFGPAQAQELATLFITRQLNKILVTLKGKFIGEALKMPISTKLNFKYTLAEIKKIMAEPAQPCTV